MILADKIINERKKNGWSQEELAEKLSVSRQSVSKWEGAQSVPDLQKIILMANLFEVSTDYLLKDDIESESAYVPADNTIQSTDIKKVNLEEANEFIRFKAWSLPKIGLGVALCVSCAVVLIILAGLSDENIGLNESLACGIGLAFLFGQIIFAVVTFIVVNEKGGKFKYIETLDIDTEYGVAGLARELKEKYQHTYTTGLIVGVTLCILCSLPLIFCALASAPNIVIVSMTALLLVMVAVAAYIFIVVCGTMNTYDMLLQEREYTRKNKRNTKKISPFASIYWLLATAIFLGYSFITDNWNYSWIIFAVGGVLYPVYIKIVKIALKVEDDAE